MFRFNKQMIMNALPGEKREGFLYQRVLTELSGKQTCLYQMGDDSLLFRGEIVHFYQWESQSPI